MEACLCNVDVFFNEHLHLKKKWPQFSIFVLFEVNNYSEHLCFYFGSLRKDLIVVWVETCLHHLEPLRKFSQPSDSLYTSLTHLLVSTHENFQII